MKKQYQKPEVHVEDFVLANNIASNCGGGIVPTYANGYTCKADDSFGTFHVDGICNDVITEEDYENSDHDRACYNTPNGDIVIFSN